MPLKHVNTDDLPIISGSKVAIVTSKWHAEHVSNIADQCEHLLVRQEAEVERHELPGTYEFPHAVRVLKECDPMLSAIVCIGIILKGETKHFEMILSACTYGLTKVSIEHDVIVINGIIPATDKKQILVRASTDQVNKGFELASAVVETVAWTRKIRKH